MCISFYFDCDGIDIHYICHIMWNIYPENFDCWWENILQMNNIYVTPDYRFLGIAWPSPVTVDLLLCTMKLLLWSYVCWKMFEDLPEPFFWSGLSFLPFLTIFNSTTLCTDMGFYICDVCCVNGKVLVGESGFIKQHAVYSVQPVADRQGPATLSTCAIISANCLFLFYFNI